MTPDEARNDLAREIMASIVRPTIEADAPMEEIMLLLEDVVAGVLLLTVKPEGDNSVLDILIDRVRERLASFRLAVMEAEGEA